MQLRRRPPPPSTTTTIKMGVQSVADWRIQTGKSRERLPHLLTGCVF